MKVLDRPERLRVVVAQGKNFGGGVEFAAQADIVIALEGLEGTSTTFALPEASLGIGVGLEGHLNLVRKMGKAHALRVLLTNHGGVFNGEEAREMGLVNRIVRRHELDDLLQELSRAWEAARAAGTSKEDFIRQWTGTRPTPSERLAQLERLWSDPDNVEVMALGQVPPWLEGEERRLAEGEVARIRVGSREATQLLRQMVDEGEQFDGEAGIVRIFGSARAHAAIGGFVGAIPRSAHPWPLTVETDLRVRRIAEARAGRFPV